MTDKIISREEAKDLVEDDPNNKGAGISNLEMIAYDHEMEVKMELLHRMQSKTELDVKERNDIIQMRRTWSRWLLVAILFILAFDCYFISMIGLGKMKFDNSGISVPLFMGESILKIFTLAVLVVKFLFNTDDKIGKEKIKELGD